METVLLYTLGVVIFFVAILASIGLHELGHMFFAKKFGTHVPQFFIGFGKTLWSTKRGETEYGIKAIPLGGFVRITGMLPPEPLTGKVRKTNTGMFTQLVSTARKAEAENVTPENKDRMFYQLAWWRKFIVMVAGPSVNIIIAFVAFTLLFMTYGDRTWEVPKDKLVIASLPKCVVDYNVTRDKCLPTDTKAPALAAGMKLGDQVLSFNGERVHEWQDFRKAIQANADNRALIEVKRGDKILTIDTKTTVIKWPSAAANEEIRPVGYLGVSPKFEEQITYGGPIYTTKWMGDQAVEIFKSFKKLPEKITNVAKAIVRVEDRDADSPVSIVGGSRFAGEITSNDSPEITVADKTASVVLIIGAFNLFIGIFNLFPFLPLDGGHMLGALWEGIRGRLARLRGKPDPGPFDTAKFLPVAYVVGATLAGLGILLIVGDLVAPVRLGG